MATTLTQLHTNAAKILGLDSETASSGDQVLVTFYANEAVRQVLIETKCRVTSQSLTPGANADYTLAASVLEIVDWTTTASGDIYPLERASVAEILRLRRATATTGTPTRFYALAGHDTVMFYPTPAAADTFTTYYIPLPTEMTTGANDFSTNTYGGIPVSLYPCVENYVLWKCADADDDASSEMGQRYRALYREAIVNARRHLSRRGGYRPAPARVNPRRRLLVPHSNSADW